MNTHFACMVKDAFKLAAKIVNNQSDAHDIIQDAAAIALIHQAAPKVDTEDFIGKLAALIPPPRLNLTRQITC